MKVRLALLVIVVIAVLAFAGGCGSGGSSDTDPASLAPADAPLYIQAVLRPQGKLKSDTEALASAISGFDNPSAELIGQIDKGLNDEPTLSGKKLSYAKDIEPWLGDQAGIFVEGFDHDPGAGVVSTTDVKAAQAFVENGKQQGDEDRSYKGVDYVFDPDGTAAGVVGDFVVIGDEKAFKDAVDVSSGGDALSGQDEFKTAMGWAPSGSLTDAYLSLDGVARAIRSANPGGATTVQAAIGNLSGKAALASLTPSSDQAELDIKTDFGGGGIAPVDLSALLGSFPADSFAAIAAPRLGDRIRQAIDQLEQAGVEGVSKEAIDQQLAALGTSLDEITKSLGDLGVFAGGSDEKSLQGAAVIATDDPTTAKNLIGNVSTLALQSGGKGVSRAGVGTGLTFTDPEKLGPQPLTITTEGDKIVIGYGDKATRQALSGGGSTLSGTPSFKAAVKALSGESLSGFVALPAVFRLAGALGANSDPGFQKAKKYLDALTYLAFGSGTDGDLTTSKIVIGVQK
jgi:hypothetical protein